MTFWSCWYILKQLHKHDKWRMLMFLSLSPVQPVVLNCKDFNRKYCIIFSFNQQEKCDRNLYCEQLLCHFRPGDTKSCLIKTDSSCDSLNRRCFKSRNFTRETNFKGSIKSQVQLSSCRWHQKCHYGEKLMYPQGCFKLNRIVYCVWTLEFYEESISLKI